MSLFGRDNITDVDFVGKDLIDADYSDIILDNDNFSGANLTNSVFNYADLRNVNFSEANLTNAQFTNTKLSNVNFTNANLTGADFTGASFANVTFMNANTTNVVFEECQFDTFSADSVDVDSYVLEENTEATGIAYEIHNASAKIDTEKYLDIIHNKFGMPTREFDNQISIEEKMKEHILSDNETFPDKQKSFNELTEIFKRMEDGEMPEGFDPDLMTYSVYYIFKLPREAISFYVSNFIKDCYYAYDERGVAGSGISCLKGIYERFYMLVGDTVTSMETNGKCNDDACKSLLNIFTQPTADTIDINKLTQYWRGSIQEQDAFNNEIKNKFKMVDDNVESNYNFSNDELAVIKQSYSKYLINQYKDILHIEDTAFPQELVNKINKNVDDTIDLIKDGLMGGKRVNKRTTKRHNAKRHNKKLTKANKKLKTLNKIKNNKKPKHVKKTKRDNILKKSKNTKKNKN